MQWRAIKNAGAANGVMPVGQGAIQRYLHANPQLCEGFRHGLAQMGAVGRDQQLPAKMPAGLA